MFANIKVGAKLMKGKVMTNYYWNDWYAGFGWVLWFGMMLLLFSTWGNWGYTYTTHRKMKNGFSQKDAHDILSERYAKGEIKREEFLKMKDEISSLKSLRTQNKVF